MLTLGLFTSSIITACGNNTAIAPLVMEQPTVQAESFTGVMKEIKSSSTAAFKELDRDADKMITPTEYGVGTPDSAKAFYAIDDNHDGKITLKEMMPGFLNRIGLTFRLRSAASGLFKQMDKSKDKLLSKEELTSGLVSQAFTAEFDKYDTAGKPLFGKDNKGKLTKSEFENLFAHIAMSNISNSPAPTDPAPADPATPPAPTKK